MSQLTSLEAYVEVQTFSVMIKKKKTKQNPQGKKSLCACMKLYTAEVGIRTKHNLNNTSCELKIKAHT